MVGCGGASGHVYERENKDQDHRILIPFMDTIPALESKISHTGERH